jgi:deoxyribodipyrimidine photo-lyase
MVEVETNVMVPIDEVSLKEEYSAATIRRKIESQIQNYAFTLEERKVNIPSLHINTPLEVIPMKNAKETLGTLKVSHEVSPVPEYFSGGTDEALRHFETFLDQKFSDYAEHRNNPVEDFGSNLSPYLHFGQISPVEIYLSLVDYSSENKRVFLDELIIRRELAINFVEHNEFYDSYKAISSFAKDTLEKHRDDERPYIYTLKELEKGKTHDLYWNACQLEMVHSGKMHGYLRMYWGKKIIEWTENPDVAYEIALYLNNKYHIDGRDPNGFAGVAWCFGKHDRPWKERDVFGSVRYMNDKGLKRKFKIDLYVEKIEHLISKEIKTP